MSFRRTLLLAGAVAFLLTGCTAGESWSDLDREATPADVVPDALPEYALEAFDPDSIRLVGSAKGFEFFLGRRSADREACLLVTDADAQRWMGGCGGSGLTLSGLGVRVSAVPDHAETPIDAARVGANVLVWDV